MAKIPRDARLTPEQVRAMLLIPAAADRRPPPPPCKGLRPLAPAASLGRSGCEGAPHAPCRLGRRIAAV